MDGEGILIAPNGNKYEGSIKQGKMHGLGKHTYADGDTYIG